MFKASKQHIVLIAVSTVMAGFSLCSIIFFTDPYKSGTFTHIFFYISLFLLSLGCFTILGIILREMLLKGLYIVNLSNSFRQAILISLLLCCSMLLQGQGLLYWWVELSLILLLTSVEIFLNLKT